MNIAVVREYLAALETGEPLDRFFTADVSQIELPNRSETAEDNRVAVEAHWTGVLAVPLGSLAPGDVLKAHFAMFFEFAGGRISLQRNYDCFDLIKAAKNAIS